MFKKCFILGLVLFPLILTSAQNDNANASNNDVEFICGDVDNNSLINMLDITYLISYLYKGGPAPEVFEAADVDNSGIINLLDITALIAYLYQNGPEPCTTDFLPTHKYLFDVWHVNYAWYNVFYGFYIDNEGYVYYYDHSASYWDPGEELTETELDEKYNQTCYLIGTIDLIQLSAMYQLVEIAAEGPYSDKIVRCFDVGGYTYEAYMYDSTNSLYIPVLLDLAGDYAQMNYAPEAEMLIEWLESVNDMFADRWCTYDN